ncbi:MAG: glycosyltransferase family 2 protein [Rhabdochlamydiaceae bacterium]|nr:glycosyltransferase family 2 protein [Candidatus Amphrikana amoebophyrae]
METFFKTSNLILMYYFLAINTLYALLIALSIPAIYKRFKSVGLEDISKLLKSESLPTISIVLPVYNEGLGGIAAVHNLLELHYPSKDLIVVNDGSPDNTMELLINEFELVETFAMPNGNLPTEKVSKAYRSKRFSNLLVLDKENGGKSDANNCGINYSFAKLYLNVDGDTILENDALLRMVRPFLTEKLILCQGATIRILNGCTVKNGKITNVELPRNYWAGIQIVEYMRSFIYGKLGWNSLGGNLIVSGAFGLFDRKAVIECGGYNTKAIGEDFELTMTLTMKRRLEKEKAKAVMFIPDPVAWTDVPPTYSELGTQRARWHQGLCDTMWIHKDMFFNPKYGMTGMLGYPYMFFGELIEPLVETFAYFLIFFGISLGYLTWRDGLLVLMVSWGLTSIMTMIAVVMEVSTFRRYKRLGQFALLFMYTFLEVLGYRQMYIWWRFKGFWRYFKSTKGYY